MDRPSPSYPGQIWLSVSPLEARALRRALRLTLSLHFFGEPMYPVRCYRDAVRRVQRKLKRAAADPS